MKKILFILLFLLSFNSCFAFDCDEICVEPYDLSHGASRFMSNVTGSNITAEAIAGMILKKSILKQANGKFKVNINSYSVKDLKKGIFKSFSLKGKNVNLDGIQFSELNIKTLCKFNYIGFNEFKKPVFKEALPVSFSVVMTQDDINKTMDSPSYRRITDSINMLGKGFFKVTSGQVNIADNQFYYVLNVAVPFVKNIQKIVICSDLKIRDGNIDFTNTRLVSNSFMIDLKKIDWLINYINPLDYSLEVLENNNASLTVRNVKIKDNKVYADGYIVIPKDKG